MYLSIAEAAAALRDGSTTSVALTEEAIALADAHDSNLGVYLTRFDDEALAAAARADADFDAGVDKGSLQGIPIGVKDIIAAKGGRTTAQSLILDPAWGDKSGDAVVVSRLKEAGAVITGKLTTMEFAIGAPDDTKPFPVPRNPWNTDYWTGGSSSGSGAGVATGLVLGALGTDTGGSIRFPAANCGISGLKATFGRVPKSGCVPLGYSYDHIGPMARSAEDCALMLSVLAGYDVSDATASSRPVDDYVSSLSSDLTGLRIGIDKLSAFSPNPDPALSARLDAASVVLQAAGATVVDVNLPLYKELTDVTMMGFAAEAYSYHRPDLQARWQEYGRYTRRFIVGGALFSGGDYAQMQRVRRVGKRKLAEMMNNLDAIVTPTSAAVANKVDGLDFATLAAALHTPYWNSTGNPVMSIPMGTGVDDMPLGLQIAGRHFDELTVLKIGYAYQQRTSFHRDLPAIVSADVPA